MTTRKRTTATPPSGILVKTPAYSPVLVEPPKVVFDTGIIERNPSPYCLRWGLICSEGNKDSLIQTLRQKFSAKKVKLLDLRNISEDEIYHPDEMKTLSPLIESNSVIVVYGYTQIAIRLMLTIQDHLERDSDLIRLLRETESVIMIIMSQEEITKFRFEDTGGAGCWRVMRFRDLTAP